MKKIFGILALATIALSAVSCDDKMDGAKGEATIGFESDNIEVKMAEFIHVPIQVTSKTKVWPVAAKVEVTSDLYTADQDFLLTDDMVYVAEPEHTNEAGEYTDKAGNVITPSGRLEIRIPDYKKLKEMNFTITIVDHNQANVAIGTTQVKAAKKSKK